MAPKLTQGLLASYPLLLPAMCRVQETRTFQEAMVNLRMYAEKDTLVTAFLEGRELVACAVTAHAHRFDYPAGICAELDLEPEKVAFRTHVYVHPDQRGKGLSVNLWDALKQQALDAGKTHVMAYAFETPAIYSWAKSRPGYAPTGIINSEGHDVLLSKLTKDT